MWWYSNLIDENVPISEIFSFSNSVCEAVAIFLPISDLVIITMYRPPLCMAEKYEECIIAINKWISNIVKINGHTPKIFCNGDFNFPSMENWNDTLITSFLDTLISSYDKGKSLCPTNLQIKTL